MTVAKTSCNRDCPDACALLVSVEDGRAVKLRGDPDDPVTQGFLCERTGRFLDRQYHPDRFLSPMARTHGELRPIGWDDALDLAAERLLAIRDASGPAAILHYLSGGSLGILKALSAHLFEQFGPVSIKHGDICSGAGDAAQELDFGVADSHDLFDLLNARTILLWGKNPHVSGVHLLPVLRDAAKAGATIVGVDPVVTKAAGLCSAFVQVRPGGDAALAMGVARWLFDHDAVHPQAPTWCDNWDAYAELVHRRTVGQWADEGQVETIARPYAESRPGAILVGWGLARRTTGGLAVRALDALGAITGNLGVPGGGVSYDFNRKRSFDLDFVQGRAVAPRSFSEPLLGEQVLAADDPPVRAIWVTAGNPISMLPDAEMVRRAFEAAEFVVTVDTHPTDTTDCSDLVLPTLTLLEDDDVLGSYGNHWVRESRPAVPPPDGPRHELDILQGLAARLGVADAMAGSVADWKRRVTRSLEEAGAGIDAMPTRDPLRPKVLFEGRRFATPSGRVNLLTEAPAPDAADGLRLLATSCAKAQSSQWSVPLPDGPPEVRVHPRAANGLGDGERAKLASRRGELQVVVRHDEAVHPEVALMEKGGMLRDGRCANVLVGAVETDLGAGAAYYEEPVRLLRS